MTTTDMRNSKKRRISKRWRLSKHGPNWSDLPLGILEHIIGCLRWVDRIRLRAVCKAWSVPNTHIPAIDELPWAMKFCWHFASLSLVQGECRLLDTHILVDHQLPGISLVDAKLIVSDSPSLKLLKLDFSKMVWVYENDLNNHVLFIGCTSFSAPAVGETSRLANSIFASDTWLHPEVRFYGSASPSRSRLYRKCAKAAKCNLTWIELPLGGIWRADDLIHAV
ncbi:hypothetical protein HRI_005118700 [Hibiscus trionum]|uniref:F-box domain-containing protein n=1 Tax=Hibiscus trionum TaxID=183268 RepID=A0A9W7JH96_HIBTR|nr:hypothetical protein HRI_005118700 [Hibiscus trionum]